MCSSDSWERSSPWQLTRFVPDAAVVQIAMILFPASKFGGRDARLGGICRLFGLHAQVLRVPGPRMVWPRNIGQTWASERISGRPRESRFDFLERASKCDARELKSAALGLGG